MCDLKWLGLRAQHILSFQAFLHEGDPFTESDEAMVRNLRRRNLGAVDLRYVQEIEMMKTLGKFELQALYGHPEGDQFLTETYLPTRIFERDYF